jgi:hypothetical protein
MPEMLQVVRHGPSRTTYSIDGEPVTEAEYRARLAVFQAACVEQRAPVMTHTEIAESLVKKIVGRYGDSYAYANGLTEIKAALDSIERRGYERAMRELKAPSQRTGDEPI